MVWGLRDGCPALLEERPPAVAVHDHEATLRGIARRLCREPADADDLVQETYERALRVWDRYRERGHLRAWLIAILHNLFLDRCRRQRRTPDTRALDEAELATPDHPPPAAWAQVTPAQLAAALARLAPEFRRVYELHVAGLSYDQIARQLGIASNTVGSRLFRARAKLKATLLRELDRR